MSLFCFRGKQGTTRIFGGRGGPGLAKRGPPRRAIQAGDISRISVPSKRGTDLARSALPRHTGRPMFVQIQSLRPCFTNCVSPAPWMVGHCRSTHTQATCVCKEKLLVSRAHACIALRTRSIRGDAHLHGRRVHVAQFAKVSTSSHIDTAGGMGDWCGT